MQIQQCLHTAILVSDLERAEHFYSQVLGLSKIERTLNVPHASSLKSGDPPTRLAPEEAPAARHRKLKYPGAWYQIGNFQIHLIVAPTAPTELQNPEKWGRNPHIALAVTDLDTAKNHLLTHNCPIQTSSSGRAALFTQDPDNNIIELSQL